MATNKPDWHSDESWEIENLDWSTNTRDFDRLVEYVIKTIAPELQLRGESLVDIVPADELRSEIKTAAANYEEKHHKIGLASHVTLWIRAFVGCKLKGEK